MEWVVGARVVGPGVKGDARKRVNVGDRGRGREVEAGEGEGGAGGRETATERWWRRGGGIARL